jgi:hypothetical protein
LPEAPENTPSVPVDDLILFCRFKYGEVGTCLKDNKGSFVKDICGEDIECSGKWKTIGNLGRYAAAISATHCNRGQAGGYVEKCNTCFAKFESWAFSTESIPQGCVHHSSSPRFFISGNPVAKNQAWKNFRKTQKAVLRNTIPNQTTMLNPSELLTVIRYCLGLGTNWGFLMALMINLSVQLYLRNKELRLIEMSHLRWDLSCISAAGILDGILLVLHHGKADEHPVLLMIWSDKNIPEFDTVWMLMLWLKLSGITSGYLFPNKKRLQRDLSTGISEEEALTYPEFCKNFYKVCVSALGVNRKFKGHTPRPSGFCLDIFRGAGDASLLTCSRSKSCENVARYSRGARAMLEVKKSTCPSDLVGLLGTYRMPLFLNEDEIRSVNSGIHSVEFNDIMKNFFTGVPKLVTIQQWVQFFTGCTCVETEADIKKAMKLIFTTSNIDRMELLDLITELNSLAARANRCILHSKTRQRKVAATPEVSESGSNADVDTDEKQQVDEQKQESVLLTITSRQAFVDSLKNKTKKEQLLALKSYSEQDEDIKNLMSGVTKSSSYIDKQWYHQNVQLILYCLTEHFNSNIDEMLIRHPRFTLSKHNKFCSKKNPCTGREAKRIKN